MKKKKFLSYLLSILLLLSLFPNIKVSADNSSSIIPQNLSLSVSGTKNGNDGTSFTDGDIVKVAVTMDNLEDFQYIYICYIDPETKINISHFMDYNDDNNQFETDITINQHGFTSGEYKVAYIYMADKNYNWTYIYNPNVVTGNYQYMQDLNGGNFIVTGVIRDEDVPVFHSISVDKTNVTSNDAVKIEVVISDELSGVEGCDIEILMPDGNFSYRNCNKVSENVFETYYNISTYSLSGDYKIQVVKAWDKASNYISYYNSTIYPEEYNVVDLSAANFTVSGTIDDKEAPKIEYVTVDKKNAVPGDTVTITAKVSDDASGIDYFYASMVEVNSLSENTVWPLSLYLYWEEVSEGVYQAQHTVGQYDDNGSFKINYIDLRDGSGKWITYYNSNLISYDENLFDFSAADFTISGATPDREAPKIDSVTVDKKNVGPGDTVTITVKASDDVSGIEFFNGSIVEVNSINNERSNSIYIDWDEVSEGVFQGQYTVEQYDENGTYSIKHINIEDRAGNYTTYYNFNLYPNSDNKLDFSAADFTISGATPDYEAPQIEFVTVDKKNAVPGDTVTITVKASDDISGVEYLYAPIVETNSFFSGNGWPDHLVIDWQKVSEGVYQAQYTVGQYDENGSYAIRYIDVVDRAGNMFTYYNSNLYPNEDYKSDFSAADFTISGATPDYEYPKIDYVTVDKKNVVPGDTVTIRVKASDDASGIGYCEVEMKGPNDFNPNIYFREVSEGIYEGKYKVREYDENGTYSIDYISIGDKVGHNTSYYNSNLYPSWHNKVDFSPADFTVTGATPDHEAPQLIAMSVDKKDAVPGDTVKIMVKAVDSLSGLGSCFIDLRKPDGSTSYLFSEKEVNGVYTFEHTVGQYDVNGTYSVSLVSIGDKAGNYQAYHNSNFYPPENNNIKDLSSADFKVSGATPDYEAPRINSVTIDKKVAAPGDIVTITVNTSDDASGVNSCQVALQNPAGELEYLYDNKASEGVFKLEYKVNQYGENGIYQIANIRVTDNAGRYSYVYNANLYPNEDSIMDFSLADFTVEGATPDYAGPELISVSIDKKNVTPYDMAIVTIEALDDVSGIESVQAFYRSTSGEYKYVHLTNVAGNIYKGYISVDLYDPIGTYELMEVYISDKVGNLSVYEDNENTYNTYKDLSAADFQASGTIEDITPPVFNGIIVDKNSGTMGDTLTFNIFCQDMQSGIQLQHIKDYSNSSEITFVSQTGKLITYPINLDKGIYSAIFNVGKFTEEGLWKVYQLELKDNAGNRICIGNQDVEYSFAEYYDAMMNFSNVAFSVFGTISDMNAPTLDRISVNKANINHNQISTISLKVYEDLSGIRTSINNDYVYKTSLMLFLGPNEELRTYAVKGFNDNLYVDFYLNNKDKAGLWKPVALILVDNARNATHYVQPNLSNWTYYLVQEYFIDNGNTVEMDLSPYSINVVNSKEDAQPPVLKKAVIDKTKVNGKDEVNITFDIQEEGFIQDNSWIGIIAYYNGSSYKYGEIIKQNGKFTAKVNFEGSEKNGLWKVDNIWLEDEAGNHIQYVNSPIEDDYEYLEYMDLNYLNITATGMQGGSEETVVEDIIINNVTVSSNYVNILDNSQVEVIIEGSGGISQVNNSFYYSRINFISPSGRYYKQAKLQYKDGKLIATVEFDIDDEMGSWRVHEISINPYTYNDLRVINSSNPYKDLYGTFKVMDLSSCNIEVIGPPRDLFKPVLKTIELNKKVAEFDDGVLLTIDAEDDFGVSYVKVRYVTSGGIEAEYTLDKSDRGFQAYISPSDVEGTVGLWRILTIEIGDITGNVSVIGNYMNERLYINTVDKLMDLSLADFFAVKNLLGDVTGDMQVDVLDLALAARSYNLEEGSQNWEARADVNNDKKVDIYDLVLICKGL